MDLYMIQQRKHTLWHVTKWEPLVAFPVTALCGAQVTPDDTHTGMKPWDGKRVVCPGCRKVMHNLAVAADQLTEKFKAFISKMDGTSER